ncbi:hypothetical protein FB45DRAFT_949385 [Roridomyces roridus]|uniref:Uncharacterized protein n=1 Tax=Roridomyces roridus TaxID=1738132 RepID=A0AAD7B0X1_9AGAR|nr:hypothetical protein FB45DRAFT_949385 [Roridomyces roridus]
MQVSRPDFQNFLRIFTTCQCNAEKELYENMVNEGAFAGVTAELAKKMQALTLCNPGEMNLVGAKQTREVLKAVTGAVGRWFEITKAIRFSVDVHHDLREMADEMVYYSQKLRNIHERRSNIRRVRRLFRSYAPFIVLFTAFAFSLAFVLGFVVFSWEVLEEWRSFWAPTPVVVQLLYLNPRDACRISDFEDTLPLLVEALQGLGETYRRLGIATNVRARDRVAINKIILARGHAKLHELSY